MTQSYRSNILAPRWAATLPLLLAALLWAAAAHARAAPESFADLAEKLLPTVVNIAGIVGRPGASRSRPRSGRG